MQRQLMSRAVVATAFLALVALFAVEFTVAHGREAQARPAMVSVREALAQLRAGRTPPTIAVALATPSVDQAKAGYAASVQAVDAAWATLAPSAAAQLDRPQRVWIWRRNADCDAAAAPKAARETQRLACRSTANLARAAWLKQYVPTTEPNAAIPATAAPGPQAAASLAPTEACAWLRARGAHLGETIAFEGEYLDSRFGPAVVRPIGCDQAIVLHGIDPAARATLDRAEASSLQPRKLVALFTARLVSASAPAAPGDAIRLHVGEVTNVQLIGGR